MKLSDLKLDQRKIGLVELCDDGKYRPTEAGAQMLADAHQATVK